MQTFLQTAIWQWQVDSWSSLGATADPLKGILKAGLTEYLNITPSPLSVYCRNTKVFASLAHHSSSIHSPLPLPSLFIKGEDWQSWLFPAPPHFPSLLHFNTISCMNRLKKQARKQVLKKCCHFLEGKKERPESGDQRVMLAVVAVVSCDYIILLTAGLHIHCFSLLCIV